MTVLNTIRLVVFATTLLFSIIVLGILANFTSITNQGGFSYAAFSLGLATSVLSLVAISASIIVDRLRRGAVTSLVMVELGWVGLLWVLWLASGAAIADLGIFSSCSFYNSEVQSTCQQYQAAEAFSFLNWIMLFGWWVTLLAMSIRAASNGISGVWRTPVTEHPGWGKNATSPYGQPSTTTTYPTVPATNYGTPPAPGQPHPNYGMPPQQAYGTPQPQQGYGTPQPQQAYGTPQPQAMYGSAPGSPYTAPQQPGYAGQPGQPGHPYPNYPQPQA